MWLVREVGDPLAPPRCSLKLGWKMSQIVLTPAWCSKLWLTMDRKKLAPCRNEFHGSRSCTADNVVLETTEKEEDILKEMSLDSFDFIVLVYLPESHILNSEAAELFSK
ncbi:hypothetical protein TNCV_2051211 [Trichonephila clavipes]|nr:hypothetical protein TNCV_2051211 [Trichonephila clavipes]